MARLTKYGQIIKWLFPGIFRLFSVFFHFLISFDPINIFNSFMGIDFLVIPKIYLLLAIFVTQKDNSYELPFCVVFKNLPNICIWLIVLVR
ncbi:MAG: hypothetical protein DYG83_17135 [Candidatus Brocadia sp. AMX2]|nr:MAG: hypothetical protein EDM70_17220 [Candidatus Brocadia sp. AMX2]MBC6933957.1 hypothetical protein [Candidatus Brocadia sp.]MBL1170017.1 hypothetical protein [Candidatus Brocadia sp. AMX1]MCE7868501.1 hypothetical protein [Candidatus Brocadia sp. AMX2]MCQ3919092.1 hypothetical protein [Candidatus Brocadia sp.]